MTSGAMREVLDRMERHARESHFADKKIAQLESQLGQAKALEAFRDEVLAQIKALMATIEGEPEAADPAAQVVPAAALVIARLRRQLEEARAALSQKAQELAERSGQTQVIELPGFAAAQTMARELAGISNGD